MMPPQNYHLFQAGRYSQGAETTLESLIILFTENERNWVESAKNQWMIALASETKKRAPKIVHTSIS